MALFQKTGISRFREITFIVQQMKNSNWFLRNQINYGCVFCVSDGLPHDFLFCIFLLLQFENMLVEVKLEVFVGVVYTELFETIFL